MPLVTTVHGWTRETARTRLYYHVDNWCLPRYDQVIAVSPQDGVHFDAASHARLASAVAEKLRAMV